MLNGIRAVSCYRISGSRSAGMLSVWLFCRRFVFFGKNETTMTKSLFTPANIFLEFHEDVHK